MPDPGFSWNTALTWAWNNRTEILGYLKKLWPWFKSDSGRGILIIGAGGVGKSTLAHILSGEFDWLLDEPWKYDESDGIEEFSLEDDPNTHVVVPPGQKPRRESSWPELERNLAAGQYRGIIVVNANGYHSLADRSFKLHPLYSGSVDQFRADYVAECMNNELAILKRMVTAAKMSPARV